MGKSVSVVCERKQTRVHTLSESQRLTHVYYESKSCVRKGTAPRLRERDREDRGRKKSKNKERKKWIFKGEVVWGVWGFGRVGAT